MELPSWTALKQVRLDSEKEYELELIRSKRFHETLALKRGDRVFLITIEGDYPASVIEDWSGEDLLIGVKVVVDCKPSLDWMGRQDWVKFHRSAFRAFSVLDLMAEA